jgi:hypothetical protein
MGNVLNLTVGGSGADTEALAENLVKMGVEASADEDAEVLVAKMLRIRVGDTDVNLLDAALTIQEFPDCTYYYFYPDAEISLAGIAEVSRLNRMTSAVLRFTGDCAEKLRIVQSGPWVETARWIDTGDEDTDETDTEAEDDESTGTETDSSEAEADDTETSDTETDSTDETDTHTFTTEKHSYLELTYTPTEYMTRFDLMNAIDQLVVTTNGEVDTTDGWDILTVRVLISLKCVGEDGQEYPADGVTFLQFCNGPTVAAMDDYVMCLGQIDGDLGYPYENGAYTAAEVSEEDVEESEETRAQRLALYAEYAAAWKTYLAAKTDKSATEDERTQLLETAQAALAAYMAVCTYQADDPVWEQRRILFLRMRTAEDAYFESKAAEDTTEDELAQLLEQKEAAKAQYIEACWADGIVVYCYTCYQIQHAPKPEDWDGWKE